MTLQFATECVVFSLIEASSLTAGRCIRCAVWNGLVLAEAPMARHAAAGIVQRSRLWIGIAPICPRLRA